MVDARSKGVYQVLMLKGAGDSRRCLEILTPGSGLDVSNKAKPKWKVHYQAVKNCCDSSVIAGMAVFGVTLDKPVGVTFL